MKPKILVISGYGINCEEETKEAFDLSGGKSEIVHINDLINGIKKIENFQIIAFPGGFAYGDDTGAGNAFAQRVRNHLWEKIKKFIQKDKLIIGICNGFQVIANLGLIPALNFDYGNRQIALLHNESARYQNRWVDLKIENKSPWLNNLENFSAVVAHGEGKFFATEEVLKQMKIKGLVALRYVAGEICQYQNLPHNPNGALDGIAGITDETGRILGLMPHPERSMFFTQRPDWPYLKEKLNREKKIMPKYTKALEIFKNAIKYFN
ncbi:phosphoribosylformylglycinamidine synthase subunit PurQ [Candidatus Daviesbacteria bacterium]|nr:phosphoribosylformylglycinamidine synthase subunit PurQ [Candidatus Daviesbacteria bacterium]